MKRVSATSGQDIADGRLSRKCCSCNRAQRRNAQGIRPSQPPESSSTSSSAPASRGALRRNATLALRTISTVCDEKPLQSERAAAAQMLIMQPLATHNGSGHLKHRRRRRLRRRPEAHGDAMMRTRATGGIDPVGQGNRPCCRGSPCRRRPTLHAWLHATSPRQRPRTSSEKLWAGRSRCRRTGCRARTPDPPWPVRHMHRLGPCFP